MRLLVAHTLLISLLAQRVVCWGQLRGALTRRVESVNNPTNASLEKPRTVNLRSSSASLGDHYRFLENDEDSKGGDEGDDMAEGAKGGSVAESAEANESVPVHENKKHKGNYAKNHNGHTWAQDHPEKAKQNAEKKKKKQEELNMQQQQEEVQAKPIVNVDDDDDETGQRENDSQTVANEGSESEDQNIATNKEEDSKNTDPDQDGDGEDNPPNQAAETQEDGTKNDEESAENKDPGPDSEKGGESGNLFESAEEEESVTQNADDSEHKGLIIDPGVDDDGYEDGDDEVPAGNVGEDLENTDKSGGDKAHEGNAVEDLDQNQIDANTDDEAPEGNVDEDLENTDETDAVEDGDDGTPSGNVDEDLDNAGESNGEKITTMPTSSPIKETLVPTNAPTKIPTAAPSLKATLAPTKSPTKIPTEAPSLKATLAPTKAPTKIPTQSPTIRSDSDSSSSDGPDDMNNAASSQKAIDQDRPNSDTSDQQLQSIYDSLTEEQIEYLKHHEFVDEEKEAAKISVLYFIISLMLMVFTAQQMSENPDGVYANVCRLGITITGVLVKIILLPFRKYCGLGTRQGYSHHLVTTSDPYSRANRMEII